MEKVNIEAGFESIDEYWDPRLAGNLNGQTVKFSKGQGEFVWHEHDDADELFLVSSGVLRIQFRDGKDVVLEEGEFLIVPAGTEHCPVADPEAHIVLFEPENTLNTGNVENDRTRSDLSQLD